MGIFGWCATGFHCNYEGEWSAPCKGSYRKLIKDVKKRGRKVTETVLVDEMVYCDCPCHAGKAVRKNRKKTTPTKSRRKK